MRASRQAKHTGQHASVWRTLLCASLRTLPLALALHFAAASPQPQNAPKPAAASSRVRLQPRLVPGDVLRYQVRLQTVSDTKRTGAIADAQGPSQTSVTWEAVLRVEVLPASNPAPVGAPSAATGAIRLRTTYEKSVATLASDTPNPEREAIEKQYARMEGRSLEFTLGSDGHVSSVQGLEGIVSDQDAVKAAQQWIAQFSTGAAGSSAGVVPEEKWSTEEPSAALPLAGHVWRSDSTYLRNEPCPPANPAATPAAASRESCAVILTRIVLVPPRSQKNLTPPEYSRNNLRTSGVWSGSGESLSYVSLQTGWVVSVTQNMSERMDVTISNGPDVALRYAGTLTTDSALSLLPPSPAPTP